MNLYRTGPQEPELSRFGKEAICVVQEEVSSDAAPAEASRGEMIT
jgi:hypothetical protein